MFARILFSVLLGLAISCSTWTSVQAGFLSLGPGVNLVGNAGFYGDYYAGKGQWATKAGMDYYLGKGMKVFRILVQWEWVQPKIGLSLASVVMAGVDGDVKYLTSHGANVIIDLSNFMRRDLNFLNTPNPVIIGQSLVTAAELADGWSKLANYYKGNPNVMFGLMNEPYNVDSQTLVASYNTVIAAIRNAGARNLILVDGNGFSTGSYWTTGAYPNSVYMLKIVDPIHNMVFDIHQYLDSYSAGQSTTCSVGIGGSALTAVTIWARQYHKQLFLGEFSSGKNDVCYSELRGLLSFLFKNTDVWLGYTWFGSYAGQAPYNNPDTAFWYSIDPGGGGVQDFSGKTSDDPRMTILRSYLQ